MFLFTCSICYWALQPRCFNMHFGDITLHNLLPLQPPCQGWNNLNNSPDRGHLHFTQMQVNCHKIAEYRFWCRKKNPILIPVEIRTREKPTMVVPLKHRQSLIMCFHYAGACFCMYVSEQMDIFLILNLTVSFKKRARCLKYVCSCFTWRIYSDNNNPRLWSKSNQEKLNSKAVGESVMNK